MLAAVLFTVPALTAATVYNLPVVLKRTGTVRPESIELPRLHPDTAYSLLFSLHSARVLGSDSRLIVSLVQGSTPLVNKTLHLGDPDLYTIFHVPSAGTAQWTVRIPSPLGAGAKYTLEIHRWPASTALKREPNNRWQDASPIQLGQTVFASADETEYIPLPGTTPKEILESESGLDWYRFEFTESAPKLIFFQIDLMDRDNIPVDVSVYRATETGVEPFNDGEDPVTLPHEVQALPGNKFTTRILKTNGTYYIRVRANHPEYKLRTRVYDPPPYSDPHRSVQTAIDYILGAGDSWHANTPRRGGVFDRVSNVHQETSLCVACHPTHFSLRAQLYATQNGYPVVQRQQLQFLSERFYNNPRPFYGFEKEGAVWARVISAPANVLGRMAVLMDLFEQSVSREHRLYFHDGIVKYLNLYYKGRDKLPPDETNGNIPLVSAYEVAWYSWRVTKDPHIETLIDQDEIKNMVDLCYQTLALAEIDRHKYADKIQRNAQRILSLQRPDGQWAMRFDPAQPEVEFQTGHALWALHAAGVPASHPQVAKAIAYLLERQQPFGGWMDPLQSYENFRTPFRETQMAVLALSAYFPLESRAPGWGAKPPSRLAAAQTDPVTLLAQLDNLWDRPSDAVLKEIALASKSNDVLVRQAAIEALGRLALPSAQVSLAVALGDPSKLVQRTAAWACRQLFSRHENAPAPLVANALASRDDRTRWAATRIFANHFAALARRPELAPVLAARIHDAVPTIRMQALKGLWQYWFWSADDGARNLIEDTFLSALAEPQHPWVERNLKEGIYNLADENIRYLYNNWIPLLARPEDRKRAIEGRLEVESRLARKFSAVLESGSGRQRRLLLAGLTEYPLRRGDIYDLKADHSRPAPPVYNRIGNDIEPPVFFGESADRFARALLPLLDSNDPELRRLATPATLLARDMKFPGVVEVAGKPGKDRDALVAELLRHTEPVEILKAFGHGPAAAKPQSYATSRQTKFKKPDETYFRAYVQPILETRGKDGYACVHCHASHTIFNATYSTALNVVDLNDPENSLILRKPTSTAETEGTLGSKTLSHGGGVRWEKNSPQYQVILNWIKGAAPAENRAASR